MTRKTTKLRYNYRNLFDAYPNEEKLTPYEFRLILRTFASLLRKSMIYEGKVYNLPGKVGTVGIYRTGTKGSTYYNYQHYKETGEKILIRNHHSDNHKYGIKYICGDKYSRKIPISFLFKFKAVRGFARELAKALKVGNTSALYKPYEIYDN